jgi:hypothetical protein
MSAVEESPSAERRRALKEADASNQLGVLASCPLSKYMDIADRLLDHFQDALDGRRFNEAYVFGLRFANLGLSSLPQHPEWKHDSSSKGRKRLTSQVGDVLCMMDVIKQRMDAEELIKAKAKIIAKEEEDARKKEAEYRRQHELDEARNREQKIRDALEEERAQFLAEQRSQRKEEMKQNESISKKKETVAKKNTSVKKKEPMTKKEDVEKSAMAKLQAMQTRMSSTEEHTTVGQETLVVATRKKNTEKFKSTKSKAKEGSTTKNWFGGEKKKSKAKEEKKMVPSPSPTPPHAIKDDTTSVPIASIAKKEVTKTKNSSGSVSQQDVRNQSLERNSSRGENNNTKIVIATSAENEEGKIEPENKEKQMATAIFIEDQESKSESSPDTSSIRSAFSAFKSNKKDSDPTRSTKLKKSTPITFIRSKIEAAKSSISMKPSTTVLPVEKPLVDDSAYSTTATIIAAQQTPRSQKEKATIDKLKRAISFQEDRLEEIEGKQIPSLLHAAKTFLKEDKRQEALKCLAHKKRLERQVDTTKAAVFNMETQMFMLESTFEDRHVQKALDEAATAIAGFQRNIGDPKAAIVDLTDMSSSLPELDIGDSTDEELMEELEEWLSPEDKRRSQETKYDDDISLLSMPAFLPAVPMATLPVEPVVTLPEVPVAIPTSPSADRMLKAVVGEEFSKLW